MEEEATEKEGKGWENLDLRVRNTKINERKS